VYLLVASTRLQQQKEHLHRLHLQASAASRCADVQSSTFGFHRPASVLFNSYHALTALVAADWRNVPGQHQWRRQEERGAGGTPPPRNWVHKKIPGCAVELNTQMCAWFGSQISLITAMSFREAIPPPNHPPRALPLNPTGGLPFPRHPVPPHLQILAAPLVSITILISITLIFLTLITPP